MCQGRQSTKSSRNQRHHQRYHYREGRGDTTRGPATCRGPWSGEKPSTRRVVRSCPDMVWIRDRGGFHYEVAVVNNFVVSDHRLLELNIQRHVQAAPRPRAETVRYGFGRLKFKDTYTRYVAAIQDELKRRAKAIEAALYSSIRASTRHVTSKPGRAAHATEATAAADLCNAVDDASDNQQASAILAIWAETGIA